MVNFLMVGKCNVEFVVYMDKASVFFLFVIK